MLKKLLISFFVLTGILSLSIISDAAIKVITIEGTVNPVMAEFISDNIDDAVNENSELLVIRLDTPGGLDTSMRIIVKKIAASRVPVAVYVSPGGARAASAGVFITLSAHIAAMAPGTNIGAAHPVAVSGKMDETMSAKAENDAAAYIRSLAEKKGRNAEWAEKAVRKSVSITENEALKLHVIDMVAPDMKSLLDQIHNKVVETPEGRRTVKTEGIKTEYIDMNFRDKVLSMISDPNVAYFLMLIGFYGLFFELTNPGAIFPGVLGALSLILALYSFQTLPVNYAGLLLIILAVILFILEVKIISYGLLTIAGMVSMVIGSLMLFESSLPFFKLSLKVILPAVIMTSLFFILTAYLVIKAYKQKPATGIEGFKGLECEARTDIHKHGQVFIHGELWSAWSDVPVKKGETVVIEEAEHLKLKVRPVGRG